MKRIYAIVLAIYTCNILLGSGEQYCFKFTWVGLNDVNCTNNIPCVEPHDNSSTPPNMSKIWEENRDKGKNSDYLCILNSDNVCIKYTYIYDNAVVNASYFCGKVIEDQTSAVKSGCFDQHTEGYTIEACACRSKNETLPCNATMRNTYSLLIIIGATAVTLFVYKMFNIS